MTVVSSCLIPFSAYTMRAHVLWVNFQPSEVKLLHCSNFFSYSPGFFLPLTVSTVAVLRSPMLPYAICQFLATCHDTVYIFNTECKTYLEYSSKEYPTL